MSRKRCHRIYTTLRLPAGLRPRLDAERRRDLALIHIALVDNLVNGPAELEHLWEWMAALLTWSQVARECKTGEAEIERVSELAVALAARYEATGRIELSDSEQQLAREGSIVMDLLAELVPVELADAVGTWSRSEVSRLRQ